LLVLSVTDFDRHRPSLTTSKGCTRMDVRVLLLAAGTGSSERAPPLPLAVRGKSRRQARLLTPELSRRIGLNQLPSIIPCIMYFNCIRSRAQSPPHAHFGTRSRIRRGSRSQQEPSPPWPKPPLWSHRLYDSLECLPHAGTPPSGGWPCWRSFTAQKDPAPGHCSAPATTLVCPACSNHLPAAL
jgi:hypothetical protein